jgi:tetratricopeptide (TPR) repeat protein
MTVAEVASDPQVTNLTAQGHAALYDGDTEKARESFTQAAKFLNAEVSRHRKPAEKNFVRFLAASQYYLGGEYSEAQKIARKIEAKYLEVDARERFQRFRRDVDSRADEKYVATSRNALDKMFKHGKFEQMLAFLADHPYVLPRVNLAAIRAACCEGQRQYRTAAVFWSDAVKWSDSHSKIIFSAYGTATQLTTQRRMNEADEYLQHLVRLIPHPLGYLQLSLLRGMQIRDAEPNEKATRFSEQLGFLERARTEYNVLTRDFAKFGRGNNLFVLGLQTAAFSAKTLGQRATAVALANEAISIAPTLPGPHFLLGVVLGPSAAAAESIRTAIALDTSNDLGSLPKRALDALERTSSEHVDACDSGFEELGRSALKAQYESTRPDTSREQQNYLLAS